MTTICVWHDGKNQTVIGGDLAAFCSGATLEFSEPKWVLHNGWALGCSGELRATNVLRHHAERVLAGDSAYAVTEAMRSVFDEHGFQNTPDPQCSAPDYQSGWLLARCGAAWDICCQLSYQPLEPNALWAIGSGAKYAIGAGTAMLGNLQRKPDDLEQMVRGAIEIAGRFDPHTGGIWTHRLSD